MAQGSDDGLIDNRYRLLRQLGRGGMGTVWQARDDLLDRLVAIKQLTAPHDATPETRAGQIDRVKREARMAARLDHTGIVRVYDVIDWDGLPAIVMEYVDGRSLAARLRESGPLSVEETAQLGVALLDALRHAHEAGVVHRDLKPDNVLLDGTRAVITDFGIARPLERATTLTMPGAIIGTPAFMAPEQIEGNQASPASDLWSLGVTLYTAIEGTVPFEGETIAQMCVAILTQPMRPPRNAGPLTPLLHALLTKDPVQRATAESAAIQLAAIDPSEAMAARTPTATEVLTTPVLAPGTIASSRSAYKPTINLDTQPGSGLGGLEQSNPRRRRPLLAISLACTGVVAAAITLAALQGSPGTGTTPPAGATAGATLKAKLTSPDNSAPDTVAFSPNGTTLATAANNGGIYLWDAATGKLTATFTSPDSSELTNPNNTALHVVAFSPNGTTLATADGTSNIYLWDAATGKLTATLDDLNFYPVNGTGICALAFSPSGTTVATADGTGDIYLFDTATGKLTATLTDPSSARGTSLTCLGAVAFSPNGTTLAASGQGDTYLWNTATGKLTATLTDPNRGHNAADGGAVAFAPNGTTLASADGTSSISLWDAATGKLTATLTDPKAADNTKDAGVDTVAFAPNAATLAAVDRDGSVYLWHTTGRKLTATLTDPDYACCSVLTAAAFAPNGLTVATADDNGNTYLWQIPVIEKSAPVS